MFVRLFVLFTVLPALEIYVIVLVGRQIGAFPTVGVMLAAGAIGAWLARRESARTWRRLQEGLERGIPPGRDIMEGLLVLVGGVLLLTPGFVTDLVGLMLLLPPSRAVLARAGVRWATRRMAEGTFDFRVGGLRIGRGGPPGRPASPGGSDPFAGESFGGTYDARGRRGEGEGDA